jgi:hypothetical protein
LVFALQVLHEPFSKTAKTLKLKVNGGNKESKRFVVTVGEKTPKDAVREWEEPELENDVQVLDDETDTDDYDDDGEPDDSQHAQVFNRAAIRKRDREVEGDEDDEDDEDALDNRGQSSRKFAKTGIRRDAKPRGSGGEYE